MRRVIVPLLALFVLLPATADPDIAGLIVKLSDDDWKTREEATMALIDAGEPALPALRDATSSADPEVRARAREAMEVVEAGLSSKGYKEFGNVPRIWAEMDREARRQLFGRMTNGLSPTDRARVFSRLAMTAEEEDLRAGLIDGSLQADASLAMAVFAARIEKADPKKDADLIVSVASWYRRNGQAATALEVLDKVQGPMQLPIQLAREVAGIYAANRNWQRAADAFGKLAEHAPGPDESDAAGERIAYLEMAGDTKEFEAGLDLAGRAEPDTRDRALAVALDRLRAEGRTQGALTVASRGASSGSGGEFAVKAGQLLLSMGRDGEALFMFRRALKGVEVEAVQDQLIQEIRDACAAAGETAIATREFALELKDPAKAAATHAAAARALSDAGQTGAAAVEWKRVAALVPGSPIAAAETARALSAAGDGRATRWAFTAAALAGPGSAEAALAALPGAGRASSPVARRAVEAEFQGNPALHATAGDVAATIDAGRQNVVGFAPSGRVLWRWHFAEPQKNMGGRFGRIRNWALADLRALPDGFLVVITEIDVVTHDFDQQTQEAGSWLATIDAETGETRTLARAVGTPLDSARPAAISCGRVVVADVNLAVLVATEISSGRTAWVRPIDRYSAKSDPDKVECFPRLATSGGLVFVPSPHGSRVLAIRIADGATVWEAPAPGPVVDVVLDGGVLRACAGDAVMEVDPATGRVLASARLGATVVGAPISQGGILAVRTRDGWVRGLSTADHSEKWKVFVGAVSGEGMRSFEVLRAAGGVFFLCRRGNGSGAPPTWAISTDGKPLRRLFLDFVTPPETWRDCLLVDDDFGRRQPFSIPPGGDTFEPLFPSGLVLVDGAALLADDAGAIARLAEGKSPEVGRALAAAALSIDPENPDILALRLRLSPPLADADPVAASLFRVDAWRALDAYPPFDPRRDAAITVIEAALKDTLPLPLKDNDNFGAWSQEQRLFNALARIRKNPADREAIAAIGDSGLRAAAEFLPPAAGDVFAAVARLRCGDSGALEAVIAELGRTDGPARMEAAEVLAWRPEPAAIDALRQHLGDKEPVRVRLSATLAVGASDPVALDVLERYGIPSDANAVFLRSASILLAAGRPKALDALANPQNASRSAGAWDSPLSMLGASSNPAAADRLEALILSKNEVASSAAQALMKTDRPRAQRALAKALEAMTPQDNNERFFLQLLTASEVPASAPLIAEKALAHLQSPDDVSWPALQYIIAEAWDAMGRGAEARKKVELYSEVFPDTTEMNNNTAWFLSIGRTPQMSDGNAAMPHAVRAVAGEPWNPAYWDTLGEACRVAHHNEAAVLVAGFALSISPLDGEADAEPYYQKQLAKAVLQRQAEGATSQ
ncbi:MAG: PQQ-binding-like beta-propeller repeat protein [Planctomycetes bacterium]|nr:PQQ-binding-like beta-propeller repeat protein [Planctomycetota bacterium]